MAVPRGARPGRGKGQKRTTFPWVEVGEGTVKKQSSGAQDRGFWIWASVEDSTHPLIWHSDPTESHTASEDLLPLYWCPSQPFLTLFFSPEAQTQGPLGSCLTRFLSNSSCWCLTKPSPPQPPPSAPSTADLILSPTCL